MTIKTAGITLCATMALACAAWSQSSAGQKFHSSTARPYHPSKSTAEPKRHSSAPAAVSQKTQSARQSEVERLERQNSMRLQAQARQTSSKKPSQVTKVRPEPAGHSNINFSYHPPRTQSAGAGSHK
jgi:cell division protein FtsN